MRLAPFDAAAPPDAAWGPMLFVGLLVVAVVAMVLGFGRITRRRRPDGREADGSGTDSGTDRHASSAPGPGSGAAGRGARPHETATDDELPTDPS